MAHYELAWAKSSPGAILTKQTIYSAQRDPLFNFTSVVINQHGPDVKGDIGILCTPKATLGREVSEKFEAKPEVSHQKIHTMPFDVHRYQNILDR